jgi:hypothetical protein
MLSVVVLYCSQEQDLIDSVLEPLTKVSTDIVVVSLSHFFNGEEDTMVVSKLQELKQKFNVKPVFMNWKYIPGAPQNFWPKELRLYGYGATDPKSEWVMFVDSDEILRNPDSFSQWLAIQNPKEEKSFKLSNYWYFMSPKRRSKVLEDSVVLIPRSTLRYEMFRTQGVGEREALVQNPVRMVKDLQGQVMFDHYSWVRSKEILLQKVVTWGHRQDRDWVSAVNKAVNEDPLTTADFVHGFEYDILE